MNYITILTPCSQAASHPYSQFLSGATSPSQYCFTIFIALPNLNSARDRTRKSKILIFTITLLLGSHLLVVCGEGEGGGGVPGHDRNVHKAQKDVCMGQVKNAHWTVWDRKVHQEHFFSFFFSFFGAGVREMFRWVGEKYEMFCKIKFNHS